MIRQKRGFTVVEVVITVGVIAILSTLGIISVNLYMQNSRDAERSSKASIIANALEKYYEQNGEYPGCPAVSQNGNIVVSQVLTNLDADSLILPNSPSDRNNSIVCGDENDLSEDIFRYTGDGSQTCNQGPACSSWSFSHKKESNNEIKTISSRHSERLDANRLQVQATPTGIASIRLSWSDPENIGSYQIQRSSSPLFTNTTTSSSTSKEVIVSGLNPNTTYYFRVSPIKPDAPYAWSDLVSAKTSQVTKPSGTITVSAISSGSNIIATASGGTCSSGTTIERQIRLKSGNDDWQPWVTVNSNNQRTIGSNQGQVYLIEVQALCRYNTFYSPSTAGNQVSLTTSVTAPSGLTVSAVMSGSNAVGTAMGGSCSGGTSIEYQIRYNSNSVATPGAWSSYTSGASRSISALQGHKYTFQQQARCIGPSTSSSWVTSPEASVIYNISAISAPTVSANASNRSFSWTAASCSEGATARYQYQYTANPGSTGSWVATTTTSTTNSSATAQGTRYGANVQAACTTVHSTGPWSASGSNSFVVTVVAPSGLTISASISASNALGTAAGGSCASGTTIERQIRYNSNSAAAAGTWSGYTTGSSRSIAAIQGHKYVFQQQARCVGSQGSSSWSSSGESSVIIPITKPATPTVTATLSNKTFSWNAVACPSGNTRQFQTQFTTNSGSNGGWIARTETSVANASATSQGVTYGINVQARCYTAHANSGWTGSGAKSFVVPMAAHPRVQNWAIKHRKTNGWAQGRAKIKTYTRSCASGQVQGVMLMMSWNTGGKPNNWVTGSSWRVSEANQEINVVDDEYDGYAAPGEMIEVTTRSRCRNETTSYTKDVNGDDYATNLYDVGNLYVTQDDTSYKISCAPVSSKSSYCAGGYSSNGTKNSTNSSILNCAVRSNGISDTSIRFTALIKLNNNPPCW